MGGFEYFPPVASRVDVTSDNDFLSVFVRFLFYLIIYVVQDLKFN